MYRFFNLIHNIAGKCQQTLDPPKKDIIQYCIFVYVTYGA